MEWNRRERERKRKEEDRTVSPADQAMATTVNTAHREEWEQWKWREAISTNIGIEDKKKKEKEEKEDKERKKGEKNKIF